MVKQISIGQHGTAGRKNKRHPVVNFGDHVAGIGRNDRERANPFADDLPVLPDTADGERFAVVQGDGKRLLRLLFFWLSARKSM
jgi:hypothetical protein